MSKRTPGRWEPPIDKPQEFAISSSGGALDRILNATPEMASQIAA